MPQRLPRFSRVGAVVLGVLCSLAMLAVAHPPAKAASPAKVQTITLSRAGAPGGGLEHFNPCSEPSDGTTLVLVQGDTLTFQNDLTRDAQVTFTDITNHTTQTLNLPKNGGTASVTPRVNSNFTYFSPGLSNPTCVGRVLEKTPVVHIVFINSTGGGPNPGIQFKPCATTEEASTLVLAPGDLLIFQSNVFLTQVRFTDITHGTTSLFSIVVVGSTATVIPLAGAVFTYQVPQETPTCFGRVLAKTPSTLPPTGGGSIPSLTAGPPWLLWGGLLTILGLAGLGATLFARRRWLA